MVKKLALAYLIGGLIWMTGSDWVLQHVAPYLPLEDTSIYQIGHWKGFFFVGVTAILLNWYLHRVFSRNRQSVRKFRQLFEDNPNPMWVYDTQSLGILNVNQAALAQYGYTREEFLQMTIKDIRPEADLPALDVNI